MIIPSEFNWYFHNFFSLLLWIIYRGATDENLNFDISFRRVWSTQNKQFLNNFAHFLSGYFQIWEIVNSNRRFAFCWNVIQFHMSLFWLHFGLFREFSESGTKLYFPANSSKTNYIIDRLQYVQIATMLVNNKILTWMGPKSSSLDYWSQPLSQVKTFLYSKKFTWLTCWPCDWERYLLTKIMAVIFGLLPYDQAAMLVVNPPKISFL